MIIHARNLLRKSFHNRNHQPSHFSGICVFSSSIEKQKVLSKTIYKQIIKWTASTGSDVPFDPIPPLTLVPPRVDASALKTMSELHSTENSGELTREEKHLLALMKSLPSNSIIEPKQLILPIENANHVKNATKLAYALNNFTTESKEDVEQIKERVSLGFEVLKSLNQLSEMLEERKKAREDHQDRGGVSFRVGQVVRHKKNRWRAIVGGWSKTLVDSKEPSQKTSLTNKSYTNNSDGNILGDENVDVNINVDVDVDGHAIEYVVHLDEGDAAHSRVRVLGSMKAKQHELEAVADDDLKRIRNSLVGNHFESFNSMNGEFVPGKILKFEYPADESDAVDILEETRHIMAKHDNAKTILCGVKEIAAKLHRIVLDTSSCAETRKLCFLPDIEERLEQIVTGNLVENVADKILSPMSSSHKVAIQHMSALFYISFQVGDMLWQRHTAEKNKDRILFPLGSVVKHRKYGFRGVVVTWDPYPKADVSNWDGLQDIEGDVNSMPFYHVIPDLNDTVKAFGQERPFRYVCQENLELCPENEQDIEVSLDDGWSASEGDYEFKAPDDLKFKHAEKVSDDDDVVISCLNELQKTLNELLIGVREGVDKSSDINEKHISLCLDHFFQLLHNTECLEDAFIADEGIKELWKAHPDQEIRWSLDDGITNLLRGDKVAALRIYDKIVEEDDPKYMEAWNKKATCHYMLGDMPKSISAAGNASKINELHYQAHAGLGLVYSDTNQYKKAAQAFRKTLSLNPWSPVSSRLNICLDTMKRLELEEDDEL